ncbi:hypothetical protein [Clostridium botulinum]|uniref:hypothetical protein n=1 Tax=Clostridium botulinum TaxID=1491 RepID=UPI001E526BCD|nr:hypothetical protein [Clostridium botulinum]MCD3329281.1 hypothetical protein [Clostridium botulinum D/C]MCD3335171.1 hypothetical protein [Clostridium botulinum D/C]MCD3343848.1 hypothetical protein [Clostridium botulinum D/C]MCD3352417.1 hypothetical protein [Clostridium botulinum D/C]
MIKFSELEIKKQIKIIDGKAELVESKINGEIRIKPFTQDLISQINESIIQKLKGNETDQELAYKLFPYLLEIEMDVDYEKFLEIIGQPNEIINLIYETLMDSFAKIIDLTKQASKVNDKANELLKQIPQDIAVNKEVELDKLYNELNQAKTTNEKNKIFDEIVKLKSKTEN